MTVETDNSAQVDIFKTSQNIFVKFNIRLILEFYIYILQIRYCFHISKGLSNILFNKINNIIYYNIMPIIMYFCKNII